MFNMLKNKTKMFLLFSLVLITMIGMTAISAADVDDATSDMQVSDASNQVDNTISDFASDNGNKLIEKTGNTKTVKNDGESGTLSDLESDINSATDSITLEKDYTSTDTENTAITINKNITIDGNGKTITAKNGTFIISPGYEVTLSNTILTGKELNGSVILNNGTLTLNNVTIKDIVHGTYQIASVIEAGPNSVTLIDNSYIGNVTNSSTATRSALYIDGTATLTIQNSKLENIYSSWVPIRSAAAGAVLNIINSTVNNLSSDGNGGVIYFNYAGTINIDNCIIENNTAKYRGGAIYSKSNTTIKNSIIRNNKITGTTDNKGGAIWLDGASYNPVSLYLENNTLSPNEVLENPSVSIQNTYVNITSPINVVVANVSYDEGDTVYAIAVVTDDNGNLIGGRSVTFTIEDNTYSATLSNGTAIAAINNLEVDNTYRVSATYSNAVDQQIYEGVIEYGNVLPAMTDYTSMQNVIDSQEAQAVVKLNNNITRAESEEKVVINKDLTINGKNLVIDASQGTVFEITNGATVTISDLTITNANSANVINITNGNLVLENVLIKDTTVTPTYSVGALIAVKAGSTLSIVNSTIENINGPLIDANGTTSITDSIIRNVNGGSANGEIYVRSNLTMSGTKVENCTSYSGFLYSAASLPAFRQDGVLTINNCTFIDNTVTMGNSVVSVANNTSIYNSKFIGNKATRDTSYASALGISGKSDAVATMDVVNCIFINNTNMGDEGSTIITGAYSTVNVTNSIFLRNDTKPLFSYSTTESKTILNANYYGLNDDPVESGAVVIVGEEYDDWEEEWITTPYDVTLNNWIVQETTFTEDPEDNTVFDVETVFKLNTGDDLTQNMPEGLDVTYAATAGSFNDETVTVSENKASNVYNAGMVDSVVTITIPNQEVTFNVTAPEIDPKDYKGLSKFIAATPNGETLEMIKDCTRGESENNIAIENRNITIDGKGFTIDENNGRLFMIQNSNVTLKNMVIKNAGSTYNPSVLQIWTGNLVLENVTIVNSTASSSGGALVYISPDSTATIDGVTFEDNTARFISNAGTTLINNSLVKNTVALTSSMNYWGYNNGPLTIENTVFDSNTGYSSGFSASTSSVLTLNNVTFTNNTISSTGSGIVLNSEGNLTINNSKFIANVKEASGALKGLVYIRANTVIDNTIFADNVVKSTSSSSYSTGQGAGVYIDKSGTLLNVTNSVFDNNYANSGSAIFNYYGSFNISNSVILSNENDTYTIYTDYRNSYANNNWWGQNSVPRELLRTTSSYTINTDNWVILEATAGEVTEGQLTVTATLNKVMDAEGTVTDLVGTLPEVDVTYDVPTGSLVESTEIVDCVSTATVQTADDGRYKVIVTANNESVTLTNDDDIIVTEESYSRYFNDDGTAKESVKPGKVIFISGELTNKTFIFDVPVNVTTYNRTQANLTNAKFIFNEGASGSNMTSIIINNTDYAEVAVFVNEATDMNITNNTITQTNNDGTTIAIAFNQTTGTTIEANNITVSGKTYPITNNELLSRTAAIQGYNSSSNFILDNDVNMVGLGNGGSQYAQDSIIGIEVRGEYWIDWDTYDMGMDESNDNMVSDNRITVSGDSKYGYGIRFGNNIDGTIINNNTVDVNGTLYACGIETNKGDDIQVLYNNVTAVATNFTYGIYVSTGSMGNVNDATVYANNINVTANDAYGIELFGPEGVTVSENVIYATGDYSFGIAGYNSNDNIITFNNMTVVGDSSKDKQITSDSIKQDICGIALLAADEATGNTVSNNMVNVTDLAGNTSYAVSINGEDNTVIDNTLIGTNLIGDAAVNATEANTVENNGPLGDLIITNDTYSNFFDENGVFKFGKQLDGSSVYLSGEFTDKDFIFNVPVDLTTAEDQAILNNSVITFNNAAVGSNISNIIINNKDYSEYVIYLDHVDDVTIENVTINQENTIGNITHSIGIIYGENISIKDSKITTVGKCLDVVYDSNSKSTVLTSSIYALATKELVIDSNTITTNQSGEATNYGTLEGLDLRGNTLNNAEDAFEDARIVNNVINTESTVYTYGLVFNDMVINCVVDNNTFNSYSNYYSNGIEAFNTSRVNITNNLINANSAEFAYGIFLSGMLDWNTYQTISTDYNYVAYNTVNCNSSVAYVIELYMTPRNTFEYNNLTANSNYSIGIAGSDSGYNVIRYNNIVLNNDMQQSTAPSYDSINSYPAGVKFVYGYMAQPGYNNVTFNNITVNAETDDKIYTVNLTTANGNTVTDNTLLGVNIVGSDSVIYSGSNNKIERNAPKSIEVTMGPVVAFIGQETSIHVSVLDEDGETVQDGIVTFTDANGKVLGVADVVDGTAAINATFTKAGESTITAVFANDYTTQTVENTLTVRKAETFITIDEFNATVGEEVTITARVVDEYDNPVTNGKVVFKVNGKTLKDANGKVIYAKVTDGVATITYTVPENWKDANITAVYSGSSKYEDSKVEDVAINMTEATPALTIEPITEDITIGTQVTIKASVTGTPAPLNSGKIVFKLNGKTLKDANGKVIYAKLVNGTVTLDYTFTDLKAKTYTLSAVLISSDYDHLEDSTNVTLVE